MQITRGQRSSLSKACNSSCLCSTVSSRALWALLTASSSTSCLSSVLIFFRNHRDCNLSLLCINSCNTNIYLISSLYNVLNIGYEFIGKTGNVKKSISSSSNINESSVGSDGLYGSINVGSNLKLADWGSLVSSLLVLLNSRVTCWAVSVVCLFLGFNSIHSFNLSRNIFLSHAKHGLHSATHATAVSWV